MLAITKFCGSRYRTSEEAFAPFAAACLGSKRVEYDAIIPNSELVYRLGSGRSIFRYTIMAIVIKEDTFYRVDVAVHRLTPSFGFIFAIPNIYVLATMWTSHISGAPLFLLALGILVLDIYLILSVVRGARAVMQDITRFYTE